jgi:hypothetical protein
MRLEFFSPTYSLLVYKNYFIGNKRFVYHQGQRYCALRGGIEEYVFKFKKHYYGIIANPDETPQYVNFVIISFDGLQHNKLVLEREFFLGFHIQKFLSESCRQDSMAIIFDNFGFIGGSIVSLPVLFKKDWIQMDGFSDVAVEKFIIPSEEIYKDICLNYKQEPNEKISKFLSEL